jgi:hypothetical protein
MVAAGSSAMAERTRLSEERLKLIRSFMGEPASEDEERSDRPIPIQRPDSGPASVRPRPSRPVAQGVSQPHRPSSSHRLRVRLERRLPRFAWLRWPLASVVLGVIVGMLIARAV